MISFIRKCQRFDNILLSRQSAARDFLESDTISLYVDY